MAKPPPILILKKATRLSGPLYWLAGSATSDLECEFDVPALKWDAQALLVALAEDVMKMWAASGRSLRPASPYYSGVFPITVFHGMAGWHWRVPLPAQARINEDNLASFVQDLAARLGTRANTLGALDFTVATTLEANRSSVTTPGPHNPYGTLPTTTVPQTLAAIAAMQAAWAPDIDRYLALDVAAGTQSHADLVRALHIERSPLEYGIARRILLSAPTTRGKVITLRDYSLPSFGSVPAKDMEAAGSALMSGGWIENFAWDNSRPSFVAGRGAKLRKLAARDALALWW